MISIFPLWTFHLYVATFQQHLHMKYIPPSGYDIPELVISIRISLIEDWCLQGSYWTKGSPWLSWSHQLQSPLWLGWPLWYICVTNDQGYVPFVLSTSRSFPHSWPITGFVTRLTRRVPLVEQELLTLPGHLRSPPVLNGVRVTRSLVLCVCFIDRCLSFSGCIVSNFNSYLNKTFHYTSWICIPYYTFYIGTLESRDLRLFLTVRPMIESLFLIWIDMT